MSLWETIDELFDDSTTVLTNTETTKSNEIDKPLTDDIFFDDDNELDQDELLGIHVNEDDDLGLLSSQQDNKADEKTEQIQETETKVVKEEKETKQTQPISQSNEIKIQNLTEEKVNHDPKENILKQDETNKEQKNVKYYDCQQSKETNNKNSFFKQKSHSNQHRPSFPTQIFNKNTGLLPIPNNFAAQNFSVNQSHLNYVQPNSMMFHTSSARSQNVQNLGHVHNNNQAMNFQQNQFQQNQFSFYNQNQNFQNFQSHDQIMPMSHFNSPTHFTMPQHQAIVSPTSQVINYNSGQHQFLNCVGVNQPIIQPVIYPQAPKPLNVFINPSFIAKQQQKRETEKNETIKNEKSIKEQDEMKKKHDTKSAKRLKDLDLLLEKRLADELENQRKQKQQQNIDLNKRDQTPKNEVSKRSSSLSNRNQSPPNKIFKTDQNKNKTNEDFKSSLDLANDSDYIKKLEEQKRKREEILRLKHEKRNQRIKQQTNGEKNENEPVNNNKQQPKHQQSKRTVITTRESLATTSDNRIVKTASNTSMNMKQENRLVVKNLSINTNEKKLLKMCNSIKVENKNSS